MNIKKFKDATRPSKDPWILWKIKYATFRKFLNNKKMKDARPLENPWISRRSSIHTFKRSLNVKKIKDVNQQKILEYQEDQGCHVTFKRSLHFIKDQGCRPVEKFWILRRARMPTFKRSLNIKKIKTSGRFLKSKTYSVETRQPCWQGTDYSHQTRIHFFSRNLKLLIFLFQAK